MKKKYIKSIQSNFPVLANGKTYVFGVKVTDKLLPLLSDLGFTKDLINGESICPSKKYGRFSTYNLYGKKIKLTDSPKENHTFAVEWPHKEWHGKEQLDVTTVIFRTIKRYPIKQIEAPEIYLTIITNQDEEKYIVGKEFSYGSSDNEEILHMANLFLEIFHNCEVLDSKLSLVLKDTKKINLCFEILPPGESPFSATQIKKYKQINKLSATEKGYLTIRSDFFNQLPQPNVSYVGSKGMSGYYIMEYKHKGIFVLENLFYGNATYVFDSSKISIDSFINLTKKEILQAGLQKDRIIHDATEVRWKSSLKSHIIT